MLKHFPRKFFSAFLFVAMLFGAIAGTHFSAHAAQCECKETATSVHGAHADLVAADHHTSDPAGQHDEADGCDTCVNCACHAPIAVPPVRLGYNPLVLDLISFQPFQHIPEVYLSKFIPPQIRA